MVCPLLSFWNPPQAGSRTSARRGAFTLVEMMIVIAMVALLLGVAIPGLSGVVQSMSLSQAGGKVTRLVEQARQRAMTENVMTALVLVTAAGVPEDGRALTLLECPPGGPWRQISEWHLLPDGVVVDVAGDGVSSFMTHTPAAFPFHDEAAGVPVSFHHTTLGRGRYAARIFLPGGGLLNPNDPAVLQLVPGVMAGGRVSYARRGDDGRPVNYYRVVILGATGRTKVERP